MHELKAGKKTVRVHGNTKRNNMLPRTLRQEDGFAGRNIKLGYCPARETGSVVQMVRCLNCGKTLNQCRCGDFEPDDSGDTAYCENAHEQYLSAPMLRRALGANGQSGEAHHIFPGNIVKEKGLDNKGFYKDKFNEYWNGIMLNGTIAHDSETESDYIVHAYKGEAPAIMHRKGGVANHNKYDDMIRGFIAERNIHTYVDCMEHANTIRELIKVSQADCLDDMS